MLSETIIRNPQLHEALLDSLFEGVYVVDTQRRILTWNRAAERITGFDRSEVIGTSCADNILRHITCDGQCLCERSCPLSASIADGQARDARVYLHHKRGYRVAVQVHVEPVIDTQGNYIGAVEIFSDDVVRTELLADMEHLRQKLHLDELTGIPNRRYVRQVIESRLAEQRVRQKTVGLLFIDIDFFKKFNDEYGHELGDQVLINVAQTLKQGARPTDVVGRWGGEEFVAVVSDVDVPELRRIAERLRCLVAGAHVRHDEQFNVTISIGGVVVDAETSVTEAIEAADKQLFHSKHSGRNCTTICAYQTEPLPLPT